MVVLKEEDIFRMYFSWRPQKSIALVESADDVHWQELRILLSPNPDSGWEDNINRPSVIKRDDGYHMWYTGQSQGHSWIGYATSKDGKNSTRMSRDPVLSSEEPWEKVAVMCPHVTWDVQNNIYRMWYSGGEQNEPNAIGYATSPDGFKWTKLADNPIFTACSEHTWSPTDVNYQCQTA